MAKAEWGTKRSCPKCSARFYDLERDPAICPECSFEFEIASLMQSDLRGPGADGRSGKDAKPVEDIEDTDDIIDEEGDIDVGDELLEEDDDTVSLDEIADVPNEEDEN